MEWLCETERMRENTFIGNREDRETEGNTGSYGASGGGRSKKGGKKGREQMNEVSTTAAKPEVTEANTWRHTARQQWHKKYIVEYNAFLHKHFTSVAILWLALFSRRNRTTSRWFSWAAMYRGVKPFWHAEPGKRQMMYTYKHQNKDTGSISS